MFHKKNVHKYSVRYGLKDEEVVLALEDRITIFLNNFEIISLLCSPDNLAELAVGFLFAEGLTCTDNDYWEIHIEENKKEVYVYAEETKDMQNLLVGGTLTSGCGQGRTFFRREGICKPLMLNPTIKMNEMVDYAKMFQKETLFENSTRGIHNAGLWINGEMIIRKDVGRHNAVDKICGYCLLNEIETKDAVLFLTGRISSEIILKGVKMQVPFIVSLSGATSLAVELARELGITLLGYARGKNAIIYAHSERISI